MKQASIVLLLVTACSTVQEVQVPAGARTEFPELGLSSSARSSASDRREPPSHSPDGKLKFFVSRGNVLPNISAAMQETAFLKLQKAIRFPDIEYATLNDPIGKPAAMDGRLTFTFEASGKGGDFYIRASLRDDQEGVRVPFHVEPASVPESFEISRAEGTSILRAPATLRLTSESLRAEDIHTMLRESVMGNLDVQSSGSECTVVLKNGGAPLNLGNAPFSRKVVEGSYVLVASRKGHPSQEIPVKIFAGEKKRVFIAWPDDPESATTAFLSAPAGLRLAVDDEVKGSTPVYLLNESAHKVEFSRKLADGRYEVLGSANPAGRDRSRALLFKYTESFADGYLDSDLWQPVTEKSVKPLKGVRTRPFIVDEQKTTLSFPISQGQGFIAWISDQDSIFVERVGNTFVVQTGKGTTMSGPKKAFQPIKEKPDRTVLVEYNAKKKTVEVELDGTTIYEGPFQPGAFGQLVVLGPEQLPVKKLDVRTGRGVYEE